jgi:hypothetical protein
LDDLERLSLGDVEREDGRSKEEEGQVEGKNRSRNRTSRLKGIVPMDYYRDSGVVSVMLAFNVIRSRNVECG